MGRKRPKRGSCLGTRGHASFKDIKKIFWYSAKGRPALTYLCEIFYFAQDGRDSGNGEHGAKNWRFLRRIRGPATPNPQCTPLKVVARCVQGYLAYRVKHRKNLRCSQIYRENFWNNLRKMPKKRGQLWEAIARTQAKIYKSKPPHRRCGPITDDPVHEPD